MSRTWRKEPDRRWLEAARGKAIKIISFLLKDLPPQHNYQVVFMRRNLQEVLASQTKMLKRRGEASDSGDERMRELFEGDLWKALYLMKHGPSSRRSKCTTARCWSGRASRPSASTGSWAATWTWRP